MTQDFYVAVDFDGTCVEHEYPQVGPDVPGAVDALLGFHEAGMKIILYTMRSCDELMDAMQWFAGHGIPLFGVNTNPTQRTWTESPKAYAHIYVDDAAAGCPVESVINSDRPRAKWDEIVLIVNSAYARWRERPAY